jgi:acetyl esterase/lipase
MRVPLLRLCLVIVLCSLTITLVPWQTALGNDMPVDVSDVTKDNLSERGPYSVKVVRGHRRTISGATRSYTLYVPQSAAAATTTRFPVVIFLHGFFMSGTQHSKHAEYLAERGIAVFLPNLTRVLWGDKNRVRNVKDVIDQINWLRHQAKSKSSPIYANINPECLGIAGNSSGGAVCLELLIRAQKAKIPVQSMCSMDGVAWDRSFDEMPRAEPSICNEHARILQFLAKASFPSDDVRLIGARHCDAENPTTFRCQCICGRSREKFRLLFQELTYLYFRDTLDAGKIDSTGGTFVEMVKSLEKEGRATSQLKTQNSTAVVPSTDN